MMYWGNHMTTAGWIFSIFGTLIIFVLIVAAIVWLVSELGERGGGSPSSSVPARELLDRRLASGEITVDQYDHLRERLDTRSSASSEQRPASPAGAPG
jgi:uncharacterized membrane protein